VPARWEGGHEGKKEGGSEGWRGWSCSTKWRLTWGKKQADLLGCMSDGDGHRPPPHQGEMIPYEGGSSSSSTVEGGKGGFWPSEARR